MSSNLSDAELLSRLVGFDTTSCNSNLPMVDFICDYLDGPSVRFTRNPNADGSKTNLVVRVGAGQPDAGDADGLILCGHMDVVPALEPEWRSDPFQLLETEEGYFGRGSADMKGFDALAVNVAREAMGRSLQRPLVLLLTYDEEVGLLGAQRFVETWRSDTPLPRQAIVGEPTEMKAVRLHKGFLRMRAAIKGVTAHSGYPKLGRNAIEPAGPLIVALTQLARTLESERDEIGRHFPEAPYSSLNIAQIRGGEATNIVPGECVIDFTVRMLPGRSTQEYVARAQEAIDALGEAKGDCRIESVTASPPLLSNQDSRLHRRLCGLLGQTSTEAVSYASDAGVLQESELMDCVLFGPGTIEVAHKPNEWLPKKDFVEYRPLLQRMVDEFCNPVH